MLSEAARVLVEGGQLILVEAFRGWYNPETKTNVLLALLNDFEIVQEHGTTPDGSDDVFQYIILRKPVSSLKL